ncbi:RHS repeat-associated core domain-containing protein [Parasediminibacterium paludis]|uniref:RHS repeat-associated core domain-containing protein n=1 Tax=Parasediminibacterium paludis TaxID=908966 RepID=A0ABV8PXF4_9BACT
MYRLNGATGDKSGLGVALKVMTGDVIDIYAKSFWHSNGSSPNNSYSLTSALTSFIGTFAGTSAVAGSAVHGATATALANSSGQTYTGLNSWLGSVPNPTSSTVPKAYINRILFDEQFRPISSSSGYDLVNTSPDAVKSHHSVVTVPKGGYLYVYCSNESNIDVFFDNLQLIDTRGPLLETDNYYPFGLTMAGISSKAAGKLENRYKFNDGTALNTDLGIDSYETYFRGYDAQIGRFKQIDIFADAYDFITPYQFGFNNPIFFNDPSGAVTNDEFNDILNNLTNTQYGGSWSANGGINTYQSDAQAFEAGSSYLNQFNGWGSNGRANSFDDAKDRYYQNGGTDPGVRDLLNPIIVTGKIRNGKWISTNVNYTKIAGFLDGDYSAQDLLNIGVAFVGAQLSAMEGMLRNERALAYEANIPNGLSRPLTKAIANLDGAIGKFGKYSKTLGVVGAGLTVLSLTHKFFTGGITKKDAFDGLVSGILLVATITILL